MNPSTVDLTFSDGDKLIEKVQINVQTYPNTSTVSYKLLKTYDVPNSSHLN